MAKKHKQTKESKKNAISIWIYSYKCVPLQTNLHKNLTGRHEIQTKYEKKSDHLTSSLFCANT